MKRFVYIMLLTVGAAGCKKPYNPPAIKGNGSYLVVEGVINAGTDSTTITLSKTVNVSANGTANPVLHAVVAVESDQNVTYPLTETTNGNYVSAGLNLDVSHNYRLTIKTSNNEQYASDFEPVSITPPIDSVGFNIITVPDTGLQIYANTHDPTNTLHYFRWDYSENWEFHSKYVSNYISNGMALVQRAPDQYVSDCYLSDVSSDIVLGSSAKLAQDVLYQSPIAFIPYNSEKIEARYRMVLRQYALTSDAYNFWVSLKTNTEQLGSIFDAQPSQLTGNIHCITNPLQPVIGYLSVCTVSSKTKFIYDSQLPAWEPAYPVFCNLDTAKIGSPDYINLVNFPDFYLATNAVGSTYNPSAYLWTSRSCADCSTRGSLIPPPFWQ